MFLSTDFTFCYQSQTSVHTVIYLQLYKLNMYFVSGPQHRKYMGAKGYLGPSPPPPPPKKKKKKNQNTCSQELKKKWIKQPPILQNV